MASGGCPLCKGRGMVEAPGEWRENGGWENCPMCHPPEPDKPTGLRWLWKWFLARFRLSEAAVCEMSAGRGDRNDFHDYPDSVEGEPWHFIPLTCKRCGKVFFI